TLVAVVRAAERVAARTRREIRFDGMSVIAELPEGIRSDKAVQLFAIDLHAVVKRGTAEAVPPLARRGIEIGAAIGDDVEAVQKQLEAEDVVVTMAAAAVHADVAAVDEHMRRLAAQHEEAAGLECSRPRNRRCGRQRAKTIESFRSERPERLIP